MHTFSKVVKIYWGIIKTLSDVFLYFDWFFFNFGLNQFPYLWWVVSSTAPFNFSHVAVLITERWEIVLLLHLIMRILYVLLIFKYRQYWFMSSLCWVLSWRLLTLVIFMSCGRCSINYIFNLDFGFFFEHWCLYILILLYRIIFQFEINSINDYITLNVHHRLIISIQTWSLAYHWIHYRAAPAGTINVLGGDGGSL